MMPQTTESTDHTPENDATLEKDVNASQKQKLSKTANVGAPAEEGTADSKPKKSRANDDDDWNFVQK